MLVLVHRFPTPSTASLRLIPSSSKLKSSTVAQASTFADPALLRLYSQLPEQRSQVLFTCFKSMTWDMENGIAGAAGEVAVINLKPFFVLHTAFSEKSDKKSSGRGKNKRRIDLSPVSPRKSLKRRAEISKDGAHDYFMDLRLEAFNFVWSQIELSIKDVLMDINTNVFCDIQNWIFQSFEANKSNGVPSFIEATQSFPIVTDTTSKQLFTGLVLTKNMEFLDDLLTFEELGKHLKSQGCHVANLSSSDFSSKTGIGGCLKSLLRQFLKVTVDAPELSIFASWYKEEENYDKPVVIIIQDIERCGGCILSDLIHILCEWVLKIPVTLLMGVSTTVNAPRSILSSSALQQLRFSKFTLGTLAERMDALVEAVFLKRPCEFNIGYKVALFMRNYFQMKDGTLTAFIRALKIACTQHFFIQPLSILLIGFDPEKVMQMAEHGLSKEGLLKAFDFQSCQGHKLTERTIENLARGILDYRKLQHQWKVVVLCLHEAAKTDGIQLLDLFCEALHQNSYGRLVSTASTEVNQNSMVFPTTLSNYSGPLKGGAISRAVHYLRDIPVENLIKLVNKWEMLAADFAEISTKMKKIQSSIKLEAGKAAKQDPVEKSKKHAPRNQLKTEMRLKPLNEKAAMLVESIIRDHMQPPEGIAFHEYSCFQDAAGLQMALIGDPRRRIQTDLLESQKLLKCSCCSKGGSSLLPAMDDTSILYNLVQEHGDQINLHDLYQSFKSVLTTSSSRKQKARQSPLKRKRNDVEESESGACLQARFCRGVTDLQIVGLLRQPSKRRQDYVQRVAFGM